MLADCCNGCIGAPGDLRVTETRTSFRRFLPMPVLDFGRAKARSMNLDDGSCDCEPRMKKLVPQSLEQSLVATLQEPVPQSLESIFKEYI